MEALGSYNFNRLLGRLARTSLWLIILFILPMAFNIQWPTAFWMRQGIFFVVLFVIDIFNEKYLVPNYLYTQKFWHYLLAIVVIVALVFLFMSWMEYLLHVREKMHRAFNPDKPFKERGFHFRFDPYSILITLLVFGLSTSITLIKKWKTDTEHKQELEREKISSELTYLKAQINPHFFFNTLNNIYALTSVNVELAQKAIHKLSRMMRYMLYETQNETTLLTQEINFIQDYIELMKLRLLDKVRVEFTQSLQNPNAMIAPMLMLPFVENGFKHGVSSQQDSYIFINFIQEEKSVRLEVKNSVIQNRKSVIVESSGIGLTNTKRRLELLYPGRHTVDVVSDEKEYRVTLQIDLS